MDKSPAIEDLEQVKSLIDEASTKYKEATSLVEKAFEIILSCRAEEDTSQFIGRGAGNHRKKLIRQIALLLEEEEDRAIDKRMNDLTREAYQTLIFVKKLEKAS